MLRVAKQFVHLPVNSLLCQVPELPRTSPYSKELDLSDAMFQVFAKLQEPRERLAKVVKSLNRVRREENEREGGQP
jgi:hypothetical protein